MNKSKKSKTKQAKTTPEQLRALIRRDYGVNAHIEFGFEGFLEDGGWAVDGLPHPVREHLSQRVEPHDQVQGQDDWIAIGPAGTIAPLVGRPWLQCGLAAFDLIGGADRHLVLLRDAVLDEVQRHAQIHAAWIVNRVLYVQYLDAHELELAELPPGASIHPLGDPEDCGRAGEVGHCTVLLCPDHTI